MILKYTKYVCDHSTSLRRKIPRKSLLPDHAPLPLQSILFNYLIFLVPKRRGPQGGTWLKSQSFLVPRRRSLQGGTWFPLEVAPPPGGRVFPAGNTGN
jgi:hypothetical protein